MKQETVFGMTFEDVSELSRSMREEQERIDSYWVKPATDFATAFREGAKTLQVDETFMEMFRSGD